MQEALPYNYELIPANVRYRGGILFGFVLILVCHALWLAGWQYWWSIHPEKHYGFNMPPAVFIIAIFQFVYVGPALLVSGILSRWRTLTGVVIGGVMGVLITFAIDAFDIVPI